MNKHRFRLIFSKTLGFLIPVAENSNAHCKPGQTCGPSNASRAPAPFAGSLKALPLAMLSCFAQPGFAEILAESGQPLGVTQSSSGVPVIEIADPNSKGLSHNRFQEFNVAKPGLIFNNSQRDGTSQIGGFVVHNPHLTKEARAILTEVSGPHASSLAGILEVFGGKADILIAKGTQIDQPPAGPVIKLPAPEAETTRKETKLEAPAPDEIRKGTQKDLPPTGPVIKLPAPEVETTRKETKLEVPATDEIRKGTQKDLPPTGPEIKLPAPEAEIANPKPATERDTQARYMTKATTGMDLKNALAKLNSQNPADLAKNPVTVYVRNANGDLTGRTIRNAADLRSLHGMQVVTGAKAEGVDLGASYGKSSKLYINVIEYPGGGLGYSFTSSPTTPLGTRQPQNRAIKPASHSTSYDSYRHGTSADNAVKKE